jgi:N-acetylglucosamine-6-phosphate deacetylase
VDTSINLSELRKSLGSGLFAIRATLVTPTSVLSDGALLVNNGKIEKVYNDHSEVSGDTHRVVHLPYIVTPGFIDLHIHGGFGFDSLDILKSDAKLSEFTTKLAAKGTTSFCPTLVPAEIQKMSHAAKKLVTARPKGSKIIGVHFEGPFVNPSRKGALNPAYILKPSIEAAETLFQSVSPRDENPSLNAIFTIAPELDGALEIGEHLSGLGAVVSAGHTDADYDKSIEAFHSGFTHVTHMYNAMRPLQHRDPGIIGAALSLKDVSVDMIMDGQHVDPSVILSAVRAKGSKSVAAVSDALLCAGLQSGRFMFEGREIFVEKGLAKLKDGTIAGSTAFQGDQLLVGVKQAGLDVQGMLEMVTKTPAFVLGRNDLGVLERGCAANLAFLEKSTLRVVGSLIEGKQLFLSENKREPEILHHMYQEIYEQPARVRETLQALNEFAKRLAEELVEMKPKMVYLIGSGSSYHAAVAARFAFTEFGSVPAVPVQASEFPSWINDSMAKDALVISVSQSGESSDTLNTVSLAKAAGIKVLCVTNNAQSRLARLSDYQMILSAGEEKAVTATKTFTASLVALYLLCIEVGFASGRLSEDRYFGLKSKLFSLPEMIARTIFENDWAALSAAQRLLHAKAVFTMGTGSAYSVALEAALKLKEAANLFAEGFAMREFLHGPIQLLGKDTCVVVLHPAEPTHEMVDLIQRFKRFRSTVIAAMPSDADRSLSTSFLQLPVGVPQEFSTIPLTVPAQLLAYHASIIRGLNPDKPDKLSKVVRG